MFRMVCQHYAHSFMFHRIVSSRSRRKIDYENVIFASLDQNTPARKIMNHSMMQQFGNTLAYDYENFEITQSISTESIDSNGPFIYTYDKGGDAASTTSTVSSITFYNKTSRNFDKSELGSMHPWQSEIPFGVENDSSGGLLGIMGGLEDIMRGLEEEEEIIFEPMSPRGSSHTRVPTLFMYCSKPAPLSPQDPPVGEKTDYGKSFCMPSKSAESGFYPKSCVSNKNSKMSTSPTSESSCIQKTKPFLPFWKRYLKPSRQYENMRGSGEECGRTNDDQFFVYRKFNNSSKFCFFLVAASLFAAATGLGGFVLLLMVGEEKKHDTTTMVEPTSDANPENDHSSRLQSLRDIVGSLSGFHSLDDPLKPQFMALNWLASKDAAELDLEYEMYKTLAERYLISLLYFATNGEMWTEQYSFLSSKHICEWNEAVPYDEKEFYPSNETGIICDQDGNVAEIVLGTSIERSTLEDNFTHC